MLKRILGLPKKGWLWLTKMKTALVLLFLVAIGAVPGALLPQRSLNEGKTLEYIQANGKTGEVFDKLGLFDVFSSPWFTAIYVLLFISLIGCIIPRSWEHYKALRSSPPAAPKVLSRMPHAASGVVDADPETVKRQVLQKFKGWNVSVTEAEQDRAGRWSLSAEKGYFREFANLVFHMSLVGILVAVAVGRLVYYEGQVIVVAGSDGTQSQFCNSAVSNFDSFRHGALFDGTSLSPFCVDVTSFNAEYAPNGQALHFESEIRHADGDRVYEDSDQWDSALLRVNHPLRMYGDRVYLQGHGYAPTFTIEWPNGEKRTETVQFRPDDLVNFLSSGAVRWDPPAGMYPDLYERRQHQISIQGLFAPSAEWTGDEGTILASGYPALTDPAVAIDIYRGDTGLDAGVAQNIFSLDHASMHNGSMSKLDRVNLSQGESVTLDDGTKITFDGAEEFVNLQVSHDPTTLWVLGFSVLMVVGIGASLFVKRRRIWVRITPVGALDEELRTAASGGVGSIGAGGEEQRTAASGGVGSIGAGGEELRTAATTLVEIAGLARTDSAGWGAEFNRRAEEILGLDEEELDESTESSIMDWDQRYDDGLDGRL